MLSALGYIIFINQAIFGLYKIFFLVVFYIILKTGIKLIDFIIFSVIILLFSLWITLIFVIHLKILFLFANFIIFLSILDCYDDKTFSMKQLLLLTIFFLYFNNFFSILNKIWFLFLFLHKTNWSIFWTYQ